jgi:hypothetical protein
MPMPYAIPRDEDFSVRMEQARRIGMALGYLAEAIGDVEFMIDRQASGAYSLLRTLLRAKSALETGAVE